MKKNLPHNPFLALLLLIGAVAALAHSSTVVWAQQHAILLENLSWDEAERALTPSTVVVIALGAESKEHGRHLQLNNDYLMAEYFKKRVLAAQVPPRAL